MACWMSRHVQLISGSHPSAEAPPRTTMSQDKARSTLYNILSSPDSYWSWSAASAGMPAPHAGLPAHNFDQLGRKAGCRLTRWLAKVWG